MMAFLVLALLLLLPACRESSCSFSATASEYRDLCKRVNQVMAKCNSFI